MEAIKIKVEYNKPLDQELDQKIRVAMGSIGAKWIGQGTDLTTGIRDLGFELKK